MCFCDIICCDWLLVLIAVIFPPLPVCIKRGCCSCDFLINILLCMLGWIPGMIHAWYIILKEPQPMILDDEERQIFIISPQDTSQLTIHKQKHQTEIRFSHPEPFLESRRKQNNSFNQENPLTSNLSPLSNSPTIQPSQSSSNVSGNKRVSSPLSRPETSYGTMGEEDEIDPNENSAPPSYENVMNETVKQFR